MSPFDEQLTRQTESCEPTVCRVYCSLMLRPGENETISAPNIAVEPTRSLGTWVGHAYIPIAMRMPDISAACGVGAHLCAASLGGTSGAADERSAEPLGVW
jgi:hypothetical protein